MCSPESEMKLSLSLPPAFSEEEGLANIHLILENCLVSGVQQAPSNLINFKHSYKLTELQELYVPFVYLPTHTTLLIISLKGFTVLGNSCGLGI